MLKNIIKHYKIFTKYQNIQTLNKCAPCSLNSSEYFQSNRLHNLNFSRRFHTTPKLCDKIYIDNENIYAFQLLKPVEAIKYNITSEKITTLDDFEATLNQNWRLKTASEIVSAFESLKDYCVSNNITFSDKRFDKLVDGLMDHCEKLTDEEIVRLLTVIREYPQCEGINAHNFGDMWTCLDDICCWKMNQWDLDKMFQIASLWYKLHLGRISDFIFEMLDRMPRKAKRLSKEHLLYTFFYINVCRRRSIDFDIEHALAQRINLFKLDELAIIAMGYFKTKSKVKPKEVLLEMVRQVTDNYETINEITLSAILKTLRLSKNTEITAEFDEMLDKLSTQIDRLSDLCCLHIALIGTSIQYYHPKSLQKASLKILNNISGVRVKEIERILLACSMFNFEPSPEFYMKCSEELTKEERRPEFVQYNRCMPCALNYLSLRNIYIYKLMDQVLDEDFIHEAYGKSPKLLPRELFTLDRSIDVECPDYEGNRLSPEKRYKGAKWLTEFFPTRSQYKNPSRSDLFYLALQEALFKIAGDANLVRDHFILPHFAKADLILCRDRKSKEFVEPMGFENYVLGDVMRPFDLDRLEWIAFVGLTPNMTIRGSVLPLGSVVMKERQLGTLGYSPVLVPWYEFSMLSADEQIRFVKNKLYRN